MNFDVIVQHVKEYLLDLPAETVALVPKWVNEAVEEAERRYNFKHMKREIVANTVVNVRDLVNVPGQFKEARALPFVTFSDGGTSEIDWAPSQSDMIRQYNDDPLVDIGSPQFILEMYDELTDVMQFSVYPYPDGQSQYVGGEYPITLPFYAFSPTLSGAENNFITNNGAFYVIYKATSYGLIFNRDETRAATFDQLAERNWKRLKNQDKRSKIQRRNELTLSFGANDPSKLPRYPLRK